MAVDMAADLGADGLDFLFQGGQHGLDGACDGGVGGILAVLPVRCISCKLSMRRSRACNSRISGGGGTHAGGRIASAKQAMSFASALSVFVRLSPLLAKAAKLALAMSMPTAIRKVMADMGGFLGNAWVE